MKRLLPNDPGADRLAVVLVRPRNPLNIGAAARAMSNFGFLDLRVVSPYEIAFREAKSAVHADQVMQSARVFESLAAAVADCELVVGATGLGLRRPEQGIYRLEEGARRLRGHLGAARAALLFGSEKFGLSNEDLSFCHWLIRIPTRPEHESMNLGQAVAVCLYELVRKTPRSHAVPQPQAPASALELIVERLSRILAESGYMQPEAAPSTLRKLRQLVRRLNVSPKDAEMLHGILRQILWRLEREQPR